MFRFLWVVGAVVGITSPAQADPVTYWSLFNIEGETDFSARYVTFDTLEDMLNGTNNTGIFDSSSGGLSGRNIIGSGAEVHSHVVPEPTSLVLLGLTISGVLIQRRRRKG